MAPEAYTWRRCDLWQNSKAIFHETLRYYPDFYLPHAGLGNTYVAEGNQPAAVKHYRRARGLNPEDTVLRNALDATLAKLNNLQ